ncbi:MAG: DpnD/PcfM family protein [Flavobacteriales bacterium]|nr:DpnD/PcfM family protein [Flavobacteriales bacterium]
METFKIEVQELLTRVIEVQAENLQEAYSIVYDQYEKEVIVLDYNDFAELNFIDINSPSTKDEINVLTKDLIDYILSKKQNDTKESYNTENNILIKIEKLKSLMES